MAIVETSLYPCCLRSLIGHLSEIDISLISGPRTPIQATRRTHRYSPLQTRLARAAVLRRRPFRGAQCAGGGDREQLHDVDDGSERRRRRAYRARQVRCPGRRDARRHVKAGPSLCPQSRGGGRAAALQRDDKPRPSVFVRCSHLSAAPFADAAQARRPQCPAVASPMSGVRRYLWIQRAHGMWAGAEPGMASIVLLEAGGGMGSARLRGGGRSAGRLEVLGAGGVADDGRGLTVPLPCSSSSVGQWASISSSPRGMAMRI